MVSLMVSHAYSFIISPNLLHHCFVIIMTIHMKLNTSDLFTRENYTSKSKNTIVPRAQHAYRRHKIQH